MATDNNYWNELYDGGWEEGRDEEESEELDV